MALVLKDRVKETTTTVGTGTITLAGAVSGYQAFSVIGDGNTTYYAIVGPTEWEVGVGTYTLSGTTLSRDTVLESSNSGNLVNFSAGSKDVFVTYPAERSIYTDAAGSAITPATASRLGFTNLAQGSALSVLGVTGNATADVASIAAASDHQVLRRSGTSVGFGAVDLSQANAITGTLPLGNGGTGQTSAPAANAALTGFTTTATAAGTTTLTNASSYYQIFTGTSAQTVQLPATSTLAQGWSFHIVNNSTGTLTLNTSTSVTLGTIPPGVTVMPTALTTTGDTATDWEFGYTDFSTITGTGSAVLSNVPTLTDPAITGTILEDVYTIVDGAAFEVDPGNGSVQLITLGANRTPKATNFAAGEAVTLMVDDGSAYTITWTDATWGGSGVVWVGGIAPTLGTSGYTVIELWKVSTQVYGALVGVA